MNRISLIASIVAMLIFAGTSYRRLQAQDKAPEKKTKVTQPSRHIRIERDEKNRPMAMQTSIVRLEVKDGEYQGAIIDLVGAVHIAHAEYYQKLNERFKLYDAVLYELVADAEVNKPIKSSEGSNVRHPIGAMQVGMKEMLNLEFQLDEVDYDAKNFVHADMSPEEFSRDMAERGDSLLATFARLMGSGIAAQSAQGGQGAEVNMLMALFSKNRDVKLRQAMAEQFQNMEAQLAGLADKTGKSTLVTERNRKAIEVLDRELKAGKRKIAIFYGAAHLPDFEKRLSEKFQSSFGEPEWLTAWNLKE